MLKYLYVGANNMQIYQVIVKDTQCSIQHSYFNFIKTIDWQTDRSTYLWMVSQSVLVVYVYTVRCCERWTGLLIYRKTDILRRLMIGRLAYMFLNNGESYLTLLAIRILVKSFFNQYNIIMKNRQMFFIVLSTLVTF